MTKKLVRDKIHKMYEYRPRHIADDKEYWEELLKKLKEEVEEFTKSENVEELVDIIEVVHAISEFREVSVAELEEIRKDKANKRGRFKKRIIFDDFEQGEFLSTGE